MTIQHQTTPSFGRRRGWKRKVAALGAACGALALAGPVQAADWEKPISDGYTVQCDLDNDENQGNEFKFDLEYRIMKNEEKCGEIIGECLYYQLDPSDTKFDIGCGITTRFDCESLTIRSEIESAATIMFMDAQQKDLCEKLDNMVVPTVQ